jgi:hypothetical protein
MTMMNVQSCLTDKDAKYLQHIAQTRHAKIPPVIFHRLKTNGLIIKVGVNEQYASGLYLTAKGSGLLHAYNLQSVLDEYLTAETVDLYDVITNMAEEIARLRGSD